MNSNKAINEEMVTDFIKLFGKDNVYFRDDKRDNGITERFNKNNTEIICLVCCEGGTEEHLDYYDNYSGSGKLAKLKYKYMIDFEWEDNCVASFHHMDTDEEEECTDENKCGECTHCARTKVCEYCGCVGGCDYYGEDIVFKCSRCDVAIIRNSEEHDNCRSNEEGDVWWCMHCNRKEDDEDEEDEEEDYKNYGVLAVGEDCEEDFGFFDTIEEAIVEYKKVSLIDYMRVVIFESENYNPDEDNVGTVPIVKSRTKKVKKQIKLKVKK
tara:strand:- start:60 stop:863 length:804 start_codon:yes stop_codon:yes gene_type:complete